MFCASMNSRSAGSADIVGSRMISFLSMGIWSNGATEDLELDSGSILLHTSPFSKVIVWSPRLYWVFA